MIHLLLNQGIWLPKGTRKCTPSTTNDRSASPLRPARRFHRSYPLDETTVFEPSSSQGLWLRQQAVEHRSSRIVPTLAVD